MSDVKSSLIQARDRALDFLLPDGREDPSGLINDEETELAQLVLSLTDRCERLQREHAEMHSLMEAAFGKRKAAAQEAEDAQKRVQALREVIWEHLIYPGDDGRTASGYGRTDIPDELLIDAVVDAS